MTQWEQMGMRFAELRQSHFSAVLCEQSNWLIHRSSMDVWEDERDFIRTHHRHTIKGYVMH